MIKLFTKKRKGFTLIELIVVIAILGILAAVAIPRIGGFRDTAKAQVNKQTAAQIKSAVAMALAAGEIKVETDEVVLFITDDDTLTIESGTIVPADAEDILSIIHAYVEEITIEELAVAKQRIEVTIDDGGGVQAEAVNVPD